MAETTATEKGHTMLDSRFPVLVPYAKELTITDQEFASYISALKPRKTYTAPPAKESSNEPTSRLIDALSSTPYANHDAHTLLAQNKTLTENADVAFASAGQPLVNAFYELKGSAGDVETLLNEAWAFDAEATLKIIFNARSIHLGKADREGAYKALGWLYEFHPQTLLANLLWLARPVIEKKVKKEDDKKEKNGAKGEQKKEEADEDFEMVDESESVDKTDESATFVLSAADAPLAANTTTNDVKYGVAHGYWKDLANMLLLAVNDELKPAAKVVSILKVDTRKDRRPALKEWDAEKAKTKRHAKEDERHTRFEEKFGKGEEADNTFKALHLTIARLFASQLRADIAALNGKGKKSISMAAKWCPSPGESHDKQTFIVSSIAEALFPFDEVCPEGVDPADRTTYLKHARIALRTKILSPLRRHLAIVERNITSGTYEGIKYERLPSLAMARYSGLFLNKDEQRFTDYLERVSQGKSRISGAVLLPSTLVAKVKGDAYGYALRDTKKAGPVQIQRLAEQRLIDGQWKTLVQRIKDSGKLENAIAVCDVSGSMSGPRLSDGTCPMDSAIGLSLLLAEVVSPPSGGKFITFSETPTVQTVGGAKDTRSFSEKVSYIMQSPWGMNTNFVAVFESLILPVAVENNLAPEGMVKTVFVFSDMQFDSAQSYMHERWTTSYERIQRRFKDAGYEMPEIVFWNLAGGSGRGATVQSDEKGVSLVSGYSQGMMKVFLDGGAFTDEIEEEVVDEEGEDGEVNVRVKKTVKKDPLAMVKKAISHPAYAMLKVVD